MVSNFLNIFYNLVEFFFSLVADAITVQLFKISYYLINQNELWK